MLEFFGIDINHVAGDVRFVCLLQLGCACVASVTHLCTPACTCVYNYISLNYLQKSCNFI